jgi:hypothetical protein
MLTTKERIEQAARAHAEGRIIQGAWRRKEPGRELVCALAAFGPDINSASDCPADLMPAWLAELVPTLDDGVSASDVPWFSGELIARANRWGALDADAWGRVRNRFLAAAIRQALAAAEKVQPTPRPDYWDKVQDACGQMITALETGRPVTEAAEAAWVARVAAAEAAWAARAAAEAAAEAAEAAWAAEAATEAATAATAARAAAEAAWAYRDLAQALFDAIETELPS